MARTPTSAQIKRADALAKKKAADQAAAKAQAAEDAQKKAVPPEGLAAPGTQVSLHQANRQQQAVDRAHRDEIRDASVAAAKAVQSTLRSAGGRMAKGKATRAAARAVRPAPGT